jgi:hypothetical protein
MTQENSALVPKDYDGRKRESKKTNDKTFDRIWKYYHNSKTKIVLEDWEDNIRIRWEAAWFMLCKAKNSKEIADFMEITYGISKSVAYDDVRHAMNLFGDPRQDIKSAKRAIAETIVLRMMSSTEEKGLLELHERYLQKYMDLNGLKDKGADSKLEDLIKKLKPQQILIVSNTEELEAQARTLQEELTKDIDFSEIKKNEGEDRED